MTTTSGNTHPDKPHRNGSTVVLAGKSGEDDFWSLDEALNDMDLENIAADGGDSLVDMIEKLDFHPSVIVLSTHISDDPAQVIKRIKATVDAEVIAVATHNTADHERSIRAAGVFCYLVLPSELAAAFVAVQCAQRVFAKRKE